MSQFSSSRTVRTSIASTSLDITSRTVELLNTFGDITPVVPLKTICGVALIILIKTVKDLRKLKDDNQGLATRSAELALAVATECSVNEYLSSQQKEKCDLLLESLNEIQAFMQIQRDAGRLKRYLRMTEFQDAIVTYNQKLDDCSRLFSITSIMEIQRLISSEAVINRSTLATLSATIDSNIEQVVKNIESGHQDVRNGLENIAAQLDLVVASSTETPQIASDDDGFRILRQDQVVLGRSLRTLPNAHIYRGNFASEGGLIKVVVKRYDPTRQGREEFENALKFWKRNFHPNLHRLLGHSMSSTPGPFLLFPDYASLDVPGYMLKQLDAGEVTSFVSTARLLHGVASGMEYIRRHCALNKVELRECLEASNMVLTPEGEVVVGHNLLKSDSTSASGPAPENLEEFLMELFWFFGIRFTYGPKNPDLSDWNWISGRNENKNYSHVRMLECFMMYIAGTLQDVVGELDTLIDVLESLAARGELTFKNIRNAVLEVRRGGTGFWYRPPTPLACRLGDVGYILDGNFIVLENCAQEAFADPAAMYRSENKRDIDWVDEYGPADSSNSHYPTVPTLATVRRDSSSIVYEDVDNAKSFTGTTEDQLPSHLTRARDYTTTRGHGVIRHRFIRSTSATIKCLTSSERIQDLPGCWNVLIENAEKMYERHKPDGLRDIGDLLLVTKIDTDMRVSSYSWKSDDETATPPPFVEFLECEVPEADKPWGHWEIEDRSGVTINETRCLQSIGFVQLDACDLNPSPSSNPFAPGTI